MTRRSLFRNSRRSAHRSVRLTLDPLNDRWLPSTLTGADAIAHGLAAGVANQAPVISDFKAIVGPNGQVTFSGKVSDDQAVEGYVVHITGQGINVAAVVLNDGTFSVAATVTGTSDITVSATVADQYGATSAPAYTTFTPTN